jgi:hypothetical protein
VLSTLKRENSTMQVRAGAHSIHAQTNDLGAERTLKKVPLPPHDSMIMTIMRMI